MSILGEAIRARSQAVNRLPDEERIEVAGQELFSELRNSWKRGDPVKVEALLARHPEMTPDKSFLLDLLYEEYCLRLEAGKAVDPDEFCQRFPGYRSSLARLLDAHHFLEDHLPLLEADQPTRWPAAGDSFLGFTLLRELGQGAFGRVFLAREPALGNRLVVVKFSLRGAAEAEVLGKLRHPNIVPVHSVKEDPSSRLTAVCMPYLGAATLCDVLDHVFRDTHRPTGANEILEAVTRSAGAAEETVHGAPAADRRLRSGTYVEGITHLAVQLADALAFVHALGICHRDLKPSNVLMTASGRPMLLDFNLSSDERLAVNPMGGTLPYMSPEQLRATDPDQRSQATPIDSRSDLYSLGVMLYELLAGSHPFAPLPVKLSSRELRAYLLDRQRTGVEPLRRFNSQVDKPLARLIERCLAYDRHDRPPSSAELAALLRKRLSWPRRALRWAVLHPRAGAIASTLLLTVAISITYALSLREPYHQRQLSQGLESYRHGDYNRAIQYFDRALQADAGLGDAYYYRGRAYQRAGRFDLALVSYEKSAKANTGAPEQGQLKACMGYCFSRLRHHERARFCFLEAIAAGYRRAEVLNNLSYCCLHSKEFEEAKKYLDEALELNPRLQAALHNRAIHSLRGPDKTRQAFLDGVSDIRRAMEAGPPNEDLYYDGACLCALAASGADDAFHVDLALHYLRKAVELGKDPGNDRSFRLLHNDPRYRELVNARRSIPSAPTPKETRLVDPVRDGLE